MATGVIKEIGADYQSSQIIQDSDGSIISSGPVDDFLEVTDGVSYGDAGGVADNVKEITKVKITGDLTDEEMQCVQALVKSLNSREGNGGVKLAIKTRK